MSNSTKNDAGFTLVELMVAATLLVLMVVGVSRLSMSSVTAQDYAARLNRVTELTQTVLDRMRVELLSSVRVFGAGTEGTNNLATLDLVGMPARLPGTRLATISATAQLRPDTAGAEITGNSLFFARLAWTDHFVCTSGNDYLVDVYRWVYYYTTPVDGGPTPGTSTGLNMIRVSSEPLADAASVDRIANVTDRNELLLHLLDGTPDATGVSRDPCALVWRRAGDPLVAGTIRQISQSSGAMSATPIDGRTSPWRIRREATKADLLVYRHHSVATNYSQASFGVGRYGIVSNAGSGFPHGFEVQTVGTSSARQTMLHLVVVNNQRASRRAWSNQQVVVDSRDL